jgi:polyhydroxybutyrate depolymerase
MPQLAVRYALATTVLLGAAACTSEPQAAAQPPSVASRHAAASVAAPTSADANAGRAAADPALAFDPPARLRLPSTLQPGDRVPLLLVLHGFGVSSTLLILKAGLNQIADQKKFAYLAPDGTHDSQGRPFWNAGKSCCDLESQQPNDVQRLRALLKSNLANPAIDAQRVFLIGYSNGAFMAQRLACDVGERIAGVISVAGAAPAADVACEQTTPLSFLEIHGDADPVVHYAGGTVFDRTDVPPHTSAVGTAQYWARHLSCKPPLHDITTLDLEPYVADRETAVQRYDDCHGSVELWTVRGGGHYVALQPPALEAMWAFVQDHPKG